jgi:hypothetical protein
MGTMGIHIHARQIVLLRPGSFRNAKAYWWNVCGDHSWCSRCVNCFKHVEASFPSSRGDGGQCPSLPGLAQKAVANFSRCFAESRVYHSTCSSSASLERRTVFEVEAWRVADQRVDGRACSCKRETLLTMLGDAI